MVTGMIKIRISLVMLVLLLPGVVLGEGMSDPTRPPFALGESGGQGGSVVQPINPSTQRKGLLSVIMSVERCAAIIDGKLINLGEMYGEDTLVEIKPQGVVLQGKQGRRSMELFPGVGVKVTSEQLPLQKAVRCKLANQNYENQQATKNSLRPAELKEKK